jgi:glucose-6-phosphate 1-epimerase
MISSMIRTIQIAPDYPIYEITHPSANARLARHGGQLLEWAPAGQSPVLYLSPLANYAEGKAIRGGIPICWPWFGSHPSDGSLPAHGIARNLPWKLLETGQTDAGVRLLLEFTDVAATRNSWPHGFRLVLEILLGKALSMTLRMQNTGDAAFPVTAALHTYLAIGDVEQIELTGLEGATYLDSVGPLELRQQQGSIRIAEEVDRIYHSQAPVEVHDSQLRRKLIISSSGHRSTVVWNPWISKAARLADLPDADYRKFVCVETAITSENPLLLGPGEVHEMTAAIEVVAENEDV